MRDFLSKALPAFKPLHRTSVIRNIKYKYKEYKTRLIQLLDSTPYIALTTDMWKNKGLMHFMAITGHYLDENFEYVSLVLGFRKFLGRHLSSRLKRFISHELEKCKINQKIVAATTDNGADIKKACSSLFTRLSCLCHDLNLVVKSILNFKYV